MKKIFNGIYDMWKEDGLEGKLTASFLVLTLVATALKTLVATILLFAP